MAIISFATFALTANQSRGEEPLPSMEKVRQMLMPSDKLVPLGEDGKPLHTDPLLKFGAKLFPAYETIIADPKSDPAQVANAFGYIAEIKVDRTRFLLLATERLTDSTVGVRRAALELLGEIGNERDTAALVAMLSDESYSIRRLAAKTLTKIGGKRDLVAMDIWLKTGNYQGDPFYLQYVKECRNALEKRLKEASKDKK